MSEAVNSQKLVSTLARMESNKREQDALKDDLKAILEDAKEHGLEPKLVKKVFKISNEDQEKRRMEAAELEIYLAAAGIAA